jgi:hypothetical protein
MYECDVINTKRGVLFLKRVDLTKEMEGPHLIMDSMLLSKEQLQEKLEALKVSWDSEINNSIEYYKEEVERLLIWYMNKNEYIVEHGVVNVLSLMSKIITVCRVHDKYMQYNSYQKMSDSMKRLKLRRVSK